MKRCDKVLYVFLEAKRELEIVINNALSECWVFRESCTFVINLQGQYKLASSVWQNLVE